MAMFKKDTKDEVVNVNNRNGSDASEDKTLKVKGSGEMAINLEAEAEIDPLTTSNYQLAINGECIVNYDIEVIINVKNSAEVVIKDPTCDSVEEVV